VAICSPEEAARERWLSTELGLAETALAPPVLTAACACALALVARASVTGAIPAKVSASVRSVLLASVRLIFFDAYGVS
jgi:hypothetical protein